MGLLPASIQSKINKAVTSIDGATSSSQHHAFVAHRRSKHNKEFVGFLSSEWPGSILNWSQDDIRDFSACFRPIRVACGEEVPIPCGNHGDSATVVANRKFFFVVASGSVEVNAVLPTKSKKTGNIREFLAKKQKGDMVYMPSVRALIAESNAKEMYERENKEKGEDGTSPKHRVHKNVLDLIDTVGIKSVEESTLLQLDWTLFDVKFGLNAERPVTSTLDTTMLRTIMETNLTDYLSKIPILEGIPFSKLEMLSRLCHYCVKKEGDVIFEEGDAGDEVFMILSGEVRVDAKASKDMAEMMLVAEQEKNNKISYFDGCGSSSENEDSSKSARKGSVCTGCDYTMQKLSKGQEELVMKRRTLVKAGNKCRREAAQRSMENHDASPPSSSGNESMQLVELAKLGSGDYCGEMAIMIDLPRAATVTAESNVLLAALSKASFRTLYHAISPQLEATLQEKVKSYMLRNIFELKSPFQQPISAEDSNRMAFNSSIVKYDKDSIIFREGWESKNFFFVYSGALSVEKNDVGGKRRVIGSLFPGDYFGEHSILNGTKRLATVVTTEDTVLLEIPSEKFNECFDPSLIAEFIVRIKGNDVDLASLLEYKMSRDIFASFYCSAGHRNPSELALYEQIVNYEQNFEGMTLSSWKRAKDIVDKYLTKANEKDYVDLPAEIIALPTDRVHFDNDGELSVDIFTGVKEEVYNRMNAVHEDTFKNSEEFATLMKRLRAYDSAEKEMLA